MKSLFLTTCLCLAACTAVATPPAHALEERLDIDPAVQGLWVLHATSDDRGKTIEYHDAPAFCRVSAAAVRFADGREMRVKSVHILHNDDGRPYNIIRFENDTLWAVSKPEGGAFILIQVLGGEQMEETFRLLVTAE